MIDQKHTAVISPRDGIFGLLSMDEEYVTVVSPAPLAGKLMPLGHYLSRFPDTSVFEYAHQSDALQQFASLSDSSLALDYTLLLFDRDTTRSTRNDVACELNGLLEQNTCREYVLDIILAAPLPAQADWEGALAVSETLPAAHSCVTTIVECQERVRSLASAWVTMRHDPLVTQLGVPTVYGLLIDAGVFRRLVEDGKTKADVQRIGGEIVLTSKSKNRCDPRIVVTLMTRYGALLPQGLHVATVPPDTEPQYGTASKGQLAQSARVQPTVNRQQAESQVEKIAALYIQGNDSTASSYLQQLIDAQTTDDDLHSHLVKSLCNIATKCTTGGRRDIALDCLTRALDYPEGIDAILYTQVGNALRDLKRYDEALACYEHAQKMEAGEYTESVLLEIIRTSIAKSNYAKALAQLESLPTLYSSTRSLCLLGTLHRRLGDLRAARTCYFDVLQSDPHNHQAFAGLAEANKQTGHYSKAITRYNRLLSEFTDRDSMPWKVYKLAQGFLFRVTHQYASAKAILLELNSIYPQDGDVRLDLAKLYLLEGNADKAKSYFEQSVGRSLDELAKQLFLTALSSSSPQSSVGADAVQILPQDQGIAACNRAVNAIRAGDFELAIESVQRSRFVARAHADFGAVLAFHAKERIHLRAVGNSDHVINRIRKRGHQELRGTVQAIDDGDFSSAENHELRMCLMIG